MSTMDNGEDHPQVLSSSLVSTAIATVIDFISLYGIYKFNIWALAS